MSSSPPATSSRLDGDSRAVVVVVTWLISLIAVTSFVIGVPGLLTVASWAGLSAPLAYGVPVVLDGGIAIMALSAVVQRARFESTRFTMGVVAGLTMVSVAAQVAHVLVPVWGRVGLEEVIGASAIALAPVMVFTATHVLLSLGFAPPMKRSARRRTGTSRPAQEAARVTHGRSTGPVHSGPVVGQGGPPSGPRPQSTAVGMDQSTVADAVVQMDGSERVSDPAVVAAEMKALGATNAEIAAALGVSVSTVKRLRATAEQTAEPVQSDIVKEPVDPARQEALIP